MAGRKAVKKLPSLLPCALRARKVNPRKVKRGVLVVPPAPAVLAVDDPRLVRVEP